MSSLRHWFHKGPHDVPEFIQVPVRDDERRQMVTELAQSRYVAPTYLGTYFDTIVQKTLWKTPFFTIEAWLSSSLVRHWKREVPKWLKRLNALRLYYGSTKSIRFILVPLDIPRTMPVRKEQCMGPENVNGGYTYIHGNTVYVFRQEEMPKVLLHEYLHQIQGHQDALWTPADTRRIQDWVQMPTSIEVRPNEAVVEYWAVHHHTTFLSLETGVPRSVLWDAEKQFSMHQAYHVWNHQTKCRPRWNESTHTLSYYILKTGLMLTWPSVPLNYTVPAFLQWFETHCNAFVSQFKPKASIPWPNSARLTLLGDY